MKAAVTDANGLIGRHLVKQLVEVERVERGKINLKLTTLGKLLISSSRIAMKA